jgi:hypothetical protein
LKLLLPLWRSLRDLVSDLAGRPPAERTQSAEEEEKLAQADDLIDASRDDDAIDAGGL